MTGIFLFGKELLHNKQCVAQCIYDDAETTVPATCSASSSKLHRTITAKVTHTNDQ
jgi:hypothetical protein